MSREATRGSAELEREGHADHGHGRAPYNEAAPGHGHAHGAEAGHGHGVSSCEGFVEAKLPASRTNQVLAPGAGAGKTLYFDMQSGIAGDMTIAALVDLGVPLSVIEDAVSALNLPGVGLRLRSGYAGAIGCSHLSVDFEPQAAERSYPQIRDLIATSTLDATTKNLATSIFLRLAEAEAEVHRTTLEHVHFHEVGAVDAIVDIVGAARAVSYLGATVKASPVPLGRGYVECRHGRLPLPAPATLECLRSVPTLPSGLDVELVTPTGAAIIAVVAEEFGSWFALSPEKVGWGAGTRGLPDRPNALRVVLGTEGPKPSEVSHALLETNIDDMTGEFAASALLQVMNRGAVDVWITPVTMKKGRPGMVFSALAPLARVRDVAEAILEETSSIGVRQTLVSRFELERSVETVSTSWGPLRVKTSRLRSGQVRQKPEFEDVARLASERGVSVQTVLESVQRELAAAQDDSARSR